MRSSTRSSGVPTAWPSPIAVIAVAAFPVLALLLGPAVHGLVADLPLGRGEGVTSIWVRLAVGTLALGALGFVALPLVLSLAGRRPWLMLAFLERGVRVALVGLAVLVALETLLASGLVLVLERLIFGQALNGSIAITLVGGFAGVFYLLRTAARYPRTTLELMAFEIDPERETALATMYRDLAARLAIAPPDHVVVGPEIMFAVTTSPVDVEGQTLAGTTLYLSWPLLRVLSSEQVSAVVAHELAHVAAGHFDITQRLDRGIERLREASTRLDTEVYDNPVARIGTQPAAIWLRTMLAGIRPAVAVVQRPYELEADRMAASLAGADELGSALVMTSTAEMLSPAWKHLVADPRAIVRAGDEPPTEAFAQAMAAMLSSENLEGLLVADQPISTHPPIAERLRAMGAVPAATVAPSPAITTLLAGGREIGSTLSGRIRRGPRPIKNDFINRVRFEVGLAGVLVAIGALGVFVLLVLASDEKPGLKANAAGWGLILMVVVGLAGVIYIGLQQEIVIDDTGVSATGWFRRLVGRRSPAVPWGTIERATVGHMRSINVATIRRTLEVRGTWLNDRDIRRIIEGLRSHGVPVRFKLASRGFDDERRAVVWFTGDAFLVPTLRRADDGRIPETEPVHEVGLDPEALLVAITNALHAPPKTMAPRSRSVDVRAGSPDARRVVIAGSPKLSTIRIDGFEDHWWDESPPDAGRAVALIFEVFEIERPDEDLDGDDADIDEDAG
jgi:Zn-dependent protease with chaperone function